MHLFLKPNVSINCIYWFYYYINNILKYYFYNNVKNYLINHVEVQMNWMPSSLDIFLQLLQHLFQTTYWRILSRISQHSWISANASKIGIFSVRMIRQGCTRTSSILNWVILITAQSSSYVMQQMLLKMKILVEIFAIYNKYVHVYICISMLYGHL